MFITKNNEQEKDTDNLKKCSKLNRKTKTMTKKLKESKRVEAQNFYLFLWFVTKESTKESMN